MQATTPRLFPRFALMALAASAVTSCSLPPQQAWRQIQRDGLIPFMVQEWNTGTPATSAPASQQQMLARTTTPPVRMVASVTPGTPRSAADLIGPPANNTPSPAMIDATKIPTADAAVGIPGYVRSPYTTPPRLVDVRGMTAGSKVVCPFTHKPFLVPAAATAPAVAVATTPAPAQTTPAPAKPAATTPPVPTTPSQVAALTPKAMSTPPTSGTPAPQTPAQTPPAPAGAAAQEIPQGVPIVGRPGFVNSPFAAKHQLVDVTGLPVGMEVKCPYTGKLFRVPPQAQGQVPVEKTASPQKK